MGPLVNKYETKILRKENVNSSIKLETALLAVESEEFRKAQIACADFCFVVHVRLEGSRDCPPYCLARAGYGRK